MLIFYIVLESILHEFCAKYYAPRWNTLEAIEVLVRPCMQVFHFWAFFGHYWPFWLYGAPDELHVGSIGTSQWC